MKLRDLPPSAIISVEYERIRCINWFVVWNLKIPGSRLLLKKGKQKWLSVRSSTFIAPHSEKEENTELIDGCIAKGVWEKITSSEEYEKVESMELEELEAYLADDPSFFPEGWLDKEPSPRWDHRRDKLRVPPAPYYRPSYTLRCL